DFIKQTRFLSQQARADAPHYQHSQIGFNYRMSNILAAIGRGQLKVLDDRVEAKRQILEKYKETLKDIDGIEFMSEATYGRSNRWITVILITPHKFGVDRETVRLALEAENIEAKPVWKPMHLQAVFDCGSGFKVQGSGIMQEKATTKIQNSKFKIQNYPARVVRGKGGGRFV
ncbi:DegT/DnrJ/EryC1/StrS family aminotransferase, partial [Thermodesulfovibrionales bacterium]|nr:DegT/DnrJ/EryC1/StrS family aminotransferase [Thermodesulfovibrionales bacterium]